jgi:hypothetical protein
MKEDPKSEIRDLRACQEALHSEVSVMEIKTNTRQTELEEIVADKLNKRLNGLRQLYSSRR